MTVFSWKLLLTGLAWSAIAYLIACSALRIWQNRLIFFPSPTLQLTPAKLGLDYEDVWLSVLTWGGKVERLHGWWLPNHSATGKVLLYLHGNGGNISSNLAAAGRFQQAGFSVFLPDYRGYGRSQGRFPSESEIYRDAQAAWHYLVQRRGIAPEQIFLYGHSLGGAVAIDLAVRQPQAAGLIVENTFTSLRDVVDHRGIYRLFPIDWLLHQRFDSLGKIELLQVPLLVVRGLADRTVPPVMGERLYAVATVPKRQLAVPEAGHNDVGAVAGDKYVQVVREFSELAKQAGIPRP